MLITTIADNILMFNTLKKIRNKENVVSDERILKSVDKYCTHCLELYEILLNQKPVHPVFVYNVPIWALSNTRRSYSPW